MIEIIPPGTDLIKSIRAEKSPYYLWAGEAVDNAFDAQASCVELTMNRDRLEAADNGIGITKDRQTAVIAIAQHGEMKGTRLGRYGIGITYKSIQHGKKLYVESVSKDGRMIRAVDWEAILENGRWEFFGAIWETVDPMTRTGTLVRIHDLITKTPTKVEIDKTAAMLRRVYYPAMDMGKVIRLNDSPIEPIRMPLLTDVISGDLSYPGDRRAKVMAGMLGDPTKKSGLSMVDLSFAYRVIKSGCDFGCHGYGGLHLMYCRIALVGKGWKLTRFKDDFGEEPYEDELASDVQDLIRPILERCENSTILLQTKAMQQRIEQLLLRHNVTRPKKNRELGRVGKKRGEKKEKEADGPLSPTGPTRKKQPPRGFMIEFDSINSEHGYGRCIINKHSVRVILASDNPFVKRLIDAKDQDLGAITLIRFAAMIYEGDLRTDTPRLGYQPFGVSIRDLLDGEDVVMIRQPGPKEAGVTS